MIRVMKYFTASLLIFFVLGGFLFTNKANAACTNNPTILFQGTENRDWSVVYHFRIVDNCSNSNKYNIKVVDNFPNKVIGVIHGKQFQGTWEVNKIGEGNTYSPTISGHEDIDLTVRRTRTVFQYDDDYEFIILRVSLASNSSYNDEMKLVYTIVNKPDLEIVKPFTYPGGPTCNTSDVTLKIINTG